MSKRAAQTPLTAEREGLSIPITVISFVLMALGIAWVVFYTWFVIDDQTPKKVADLGDWNFAIGFGVMFAGLLLASHRGTPLGRGRGVVIAMLGSFFIGLIWIITYYLTSQDASVPLIEDLGNYNLLVGIGFLATGFVYATKWE